MSLPGERAPGPAFLSCHPQCPRAVGSSRNEPCVVSCASSRVIIYPPPVVVTFPGPIVSTCPQETVVGSSMALHGAGPAPQEAVLRSSMALHGAGPAPQEAVVRSSMALRGAGPAPLTPLRAQIPQPEPGPTRRSPPKKRCSYIFASRWTHPCSRAGSRSSQEAESGGQVEEKEGPETENVDAGNEDKEAVEEPRSENTPEGLAGSCCSSGTDLPLSP